MPALVAMRHNPDLRSTYLSLMDKRKHAKVALTALMRRLVLLANVLLRNDRVFELSTLSITTPHQITRNIELSTTSCIER